MKKFVLLVMMAIAPSIAWSGVGDEFTVTTQNGVEMTFRIISETEKTCEVYGFDWRTPSISVETGGEVYIPDHANGYLVTGIAQYSFTYCSEMTSISIPATVKTIATMAFSDNLKLSTIIVDEGNTTLDSRDQCNAVIQTATNTLIVGCKNTVIPNSVTALGFYSFLDCHSLASINIPASVSSINTNAFRGCSGLDEITVDENNPVYDSRENCNAVIETASNTLVVGTNNTIIPQSVTTIGEFSFYSRSNLKAIHIPSLVRTIENSAFSYSGLESIDIPCRVIGESAFNTTPLKEVKLSNLLRTIGSKAFNSCGSLTSITIPASVTNIGEDAFRWTRLKTIVSCIDNPFDIGNNTFKYDSDVTLYVPSGTKALYVETPGWNRFSTIIEDEKIVSNLKGDINDDGYLDVRDLVKLADMIMHKDTE